MQLATESCDALRGNPELTLGTSTDVKADEVISVDDLDGLWDVNGFYFGRPVTRRAKVQSGNVTFLELSVADGGDTLEPTPWGFKLKEFVTISVSTTQIVWQYTFADETLSGKITEKNKDETFEVEFTYRNTAFTGTIEASALRSLSGSRLRKGSKVEYYYEDKPITWSRKGKARKARKASAITFGHEDIKRIGQSLLE